MDITIEEINDLFNCLGGTPDNQNASAEAFDMGAQDALIIKL